MTRRVIPDQTNLQGQTKLDMRISTAFGKELAEEINYSIEKSQSSILTTLPDVLVVTQKQFISLQTYTEEMFHTSDRMYITPFNVMEVQIDRDIDTVPFVEEILQEMDDIEAADIARDALEESGAIINQEGGNHEQNATGSQHKPGQK